MEEAHPGETDEERHEDTPRAPGVISAGPREGHQDGHDGGAEDGVAGPVDLPGAAGEGGLPDVADAQEQQLKDESEAAEGQVQVEHPSPVVAGHDSADGRADGGADTEEGEYQRHVLRPLAHRHQVADDDLRHAVDAAAAEALDQAARDQHGRRGCAAADAASDDERGDCEDRRPCFDKVPN